MAEPVAPLQPPAPDAAARQRAESLEQEAMNAYYSRDADALRRLIRQILNPKGTP